MTITGTPRFGLTQWSDGATDGPTRLQFNDDFDSIDDLGAQYVIGTAANKQLEPPGLEGRYYWTKDTRQHFFDDGDIWITLPTYDTAGVFSKVQTVSSSDNPQMLLETASNAGYAGARLKRRLVSDGSTFVQGDMQVNSATLSIFAYKNSTSGSIKTNISGMEGRWVINSDDVTVAPTDTFVVRTRNGVEHSRFTETGFLGVGNPSPIFRLDVRSSTSVPVARFGGPVADDQENALTMTPLGAGRMAFVFGGEVSGATYTARETAAGVLDVNGAQLSFYSNTGLTAGNSFSPTKRFDIATNGVMAVAEGRFGTGALNSSSTAFVVVGNIGQTNQAQVVAERIGTANIDLKLASKGTGVIYLNGNNQDIATFRRASNGNLISGFSGFMVAGDYLGDTGNNAGTNFPAFQVKRIADTANGSGQVESQHFLGGFNAARILMVCSWVKGPNGEAVAMHVDAVNGERVYASAPNSGYAGRPVVHGIMFAETPSLWT